MDCEQPAAGRRLIASRHTRAVGRNDLIILKLALPCGAPAPQRADLSTASEPAPGFVAALGSGSLRGSVASLNREARVKSKESRLMCAVPP
jgi:hypothetical protein